MFPFIYVLICCTGELESKLRTKGAPSLISVSLHQSSDIHSDGCDDDREASAPTPTTAKHWSHAPHQEVAAPAAAVLHPVQLDLSWMINRNG